MDELARKLASLNDNLAPSWGDPRSDRVYESMRRVRRRRRRIRNALGCTGVLVASVLWVARPLWTSSSDAERPLASQGQTTPSPGVIQASQRAHMVDESDSDSRGQASEHVPAIVGVSRVLAAAQTVELADGSLVRGASPAADLLIRHNEVGHIDVRLSSGTAHFEVVPNKPQREFLVSAGNVEVAVVGTVFEVEHQTDRVRVAVSEGKVRVRSGSNISFVQAGQSSWFAQASEPETAAAKPDHDAVGSRARPQHAAWRSLSQAGDFAGAYRLLAEGAAVPNEPEALIEAADTARLTDHPAAAAKYLRKVLALHRTSPVAPLAGFMLGRILLERLGSPLDAAQAFATTRALAPRGSLAQDALAREVEAYSKAGHSQEAYQRAQLYVERYPQGVRLRAVQLYGGLRVP